jgi:mycothiol synthase
LDQESTARLFLGDPAVKDEGIFFLAADDDYIATATDKWLPELEVGYLHMVAVAPPYGGKGLGRFISLAALLHMRERGCQQAMLDTDDFRLPAISTYLGLGFVPDLLAANHAERWRAIFAEISASRPSSQVVSRAGR